MPSRQVWYQSVGVSQLGQSNGFQQISFPIPQSLRTHLQSQFSDLEFLIAVNGPAKFVLDELDLGATIDPEPNEDPEDPEWDQVFEFNIPVPKFADLQSIPLVAGESLDLEAFTQVRSASGSWGTVSNSGNAPMTFEPDVKVGSIISAGDIVLNHRVKVFGDVFTNGALVQNQLEGVELNGGEHTHENMTFVQNPYKVGFPQLGFTEKNVMNNSTQSAEPGAFSRLWVYSGSTLQLTTGTYYIQDFGIEPSAKVMLNQENGPVRLNIKGQFLYHGDVTTTDDSFPNLIVNYMGNQPLTLETSFRGKVLAPYTLLEFATTSSAHQGWFFAKNIIVRPNAVVRHRWTTSMIDKITISDSTPCMGQPITVEAVLAYGMSAPQVSIGGIPASKNSMVFRTNPGPRLIPISVADGTRTETMTAHIDVQDCSVAQPILGARPSYVDEREWDFWLEELPPTNGTRSYHWTFGDGQTAVTATPTARHSYADALDAESVHATFDIVVTVSEPGQADIVAPRTIMVASIYGLNRAKGVVVPHSSAPRVEPGKVSWDFEYSVENIEDIALTLTPTTASYSYCGTEERETVQLATSAVSIAAGDTVSGVLNLTPPAAPDNVCTVSVDLHGSLSDGTPAVVTLYHQFVRASGREFPLTRPSLLNAINDAAQSGLLQNPNYVTEEEILSLLRQGKIPDPNLGGDPPPQLLSSTTISAGEPCSPATENREGFFCSPTDKWMVTPGEIINALRGDLIESPSCAGLVGTMLAALQPLQYYSHVGIMTEDRTKLISATTPDSRAKDFPVDGDNPGLPTDGFQEQPLKFGWPGNLEQTVHEALYGGFYEDPIGGSYRMGPFQLESRECGSGDNARLIAPAVIKPPPEFESAVRPVLHDLVDEIMSPAHEVHYRFFSYTDATIGTKRNAEGGIIGRLEGPFDDHTDWAVGTIPAVCSTLIWEAAHRLQEKGATFILEGNATEAIDQEIRRGVQVGTEDGLYFYSSSERRGAAIEFYDYVYNKVSEKDSTGLGQFLTDIADDIATQATFCFAFDECSEDAKDEVFVGADNDYADYDEWFASAFDPGPGNTVSPDNLMLWDSPAEGGLYGYMERMMYVGSRLRRQFEWQPASGTVAITVEVTKDGAAAAGATVTIGQDVVGAQRTAKTGEDGIAVLQNLSVGATTTLYPVHASLLEEEAPGSEFSGQILFAGDKTVEVIPGQVPEQVEIELLGGDPNFREIEVSGSVEVLDDDGESDDIEKKTFEVAGKAEVNPFFTPELDLGGNSWCVDGEVASRLEVRVAYVDEQAKAIGSVVVVAGDDPVDISAHPIGTFVARFRARIWEDWGVGDCEYDSEEEEADDKKTVIVPPGETVTVPELRALNEGYGDKAIYNLQVKNVGQFNSYPLPEADDETPDLNPMHRRVIVEADARIEDDDNISPDDVGTHHVTVEVLVDPWARIGEASSGRAACEDEEVVGELKVRARLKEDLTTVEVALTGKVLEGTSCSGAEACGESTRFFFVEREQTVNVSEPMVANCFFPALESESLVEYKNVTIRNLQAP